MSDGIEAVIKASRARGGFSKKGYFTLATDKAKRKVSEYALPDPFFYCLEFVQSAVAVGAVYVDVATSERYCILSFAGAHYTRKDMEYMFEFLVTTRQEDAFRARRRLAIGIAAALSLHRAKVVIETGDGTLEGSTRFELDDIKSEAIIGTPKKAIGGTFIKITHSKYVNVFEDCSREKNVLMDRCEHLPITLVIDGDMPFGYAAKRIPKLHGYRHTISFDEGDLYGSVAVPGGWRSNETVQILTNGIAIATTDITTPFGALSGVVTFDRLNKTAGQYEIVQDDRVDELKERLKRYVDALARQVGASNEARLDYLVDTPVEEMALQDDTFKWMLPGQPFSVTMEFALDKRREETMLIHFVWKRRDSQCLIRSLKYAFPLPIEGFVSFSGDFLEVLRFTKPGPRVKASDKTILTLTAEMWEALRAQIDEKKEEMLAHFTPQHTAWKAQKEQETPPREEPEIDTMGKETTKEWSAVMENQPATTSEVPISPRQEDRMALERLGVTAEGYKRDADVETADPKEEAPGILTVPTGRMTPPPPDADGKADGKKSSDSESIAAEPELPTYSLKFPSLEELFEILRDPAAKETQPDSRLVLLHRLLYMNGRNHDFFSTCRHRIRLFHTVPTRPVAYAHAENLADPSSAVLINTGVPLVAKLMAECHENPHAMYALALAVADALKHQSLTDSAIHIFHEATLVSEILRNV